MTQQPRDLQIELPPWLPEYAAPVTALTSLEERMAWVIAAARRNMTENTGGPFAAAVFEADSGCLVSLGVNIVVTSGLSILHAEMIALALAQRKVERYDLGAPGLPRHELVTSTEPCAMCFGAIPWSGVRRVVTGASAADARAVGFDEGPKPADWQGEFTRRGIEVVTDVLRVEAAQVLKDYAASGGRIYNARSSD